MGKSPLRLIILRSWHDHQTFTDHLECGHSVWQFAEFDRDNPGINLPVTTKRRRCQECKALAFAQEQTFHRKISALPPKKPAASAREDRRKAA